MSILAIPPAVIVIVILSLFYGSLAHLWKGKTWRDLGFLILFALLGFTIGQVIGMVLQLDVLKMGQVHLVEGTIFAWLVMLAFMGLKG